MHLKPSRCPKKDNSPFSTFSLQLSPFFNQAIAMVRRTLPRVRRQRPCAGAESRICLCNAQYKSAILQILLLALLLKIILVGQRCATCLSSLTWRPPDSASKEQNLWFLPLAPQNLLGHIEGATRRLGARGGLQGEVFCGYGPRPRWTVGCAGCGPCSHGGLAPPPSAGCALSGPLFPILS